MVKDQDVSSGLTKNDYLIAGSLSGLVSRAIVQPLDVLKIRFQLQVEPIRECRTSKYHGFIQAIKCINKEEGVLAFWKGHVPAQLQAVSFAGVQFLTFEIVASWYLEIEKCLGLQSSSSGSMITSASAVGNFTCGCLAGSFAAAVTQPLDVLRTRFIAQGEPKVYRNLAHAAVYIAAREGPHGFFRGLVPSLLLIAPQTGMQFAIYHTFNDLANSFRERWELRRRENLVSCGNSNESKDLSNGKRMEVNHIGTIQSMIAGGLAGMGSKCFIYPLDMAKKRMQIQGFEEARARFGQVPHSKGLRGCLFEIWKKEGASALFKGLRPTLLKSCVSISCRFTVYEQFCRYLAYYRDPSRSGRTF